MEKVMDLICLVVGVYFSGKQLKPNHGFAEPKFYTISGSHPRETAHKLGGRKQLSTSVSEDKFNAVFALNFHLFFFSLFLPFHTLSHPFYLNC